MPDVSEISGGGAPLRGPARDPTRLVFALGVGLLAAVVGALAFAAVVVVTGFEDTLMYWALAGLVALSVAFTPTRRRTGCG